MLYTQSIVIMEDNKIKEIKELNLDTDEDFIIIEIVSKNNEVITKTSLGLGIIRIEASYMPVTIKYLTKKGILLSSEQIEIVSSSIENLSEEEIKMKKYETFIKGKMDFPTGTKDDINFHSLMLQKSTYDTNAQIYVVSKIKQYLMAEKSFNFTSNEVQEYAEKIFNNLYGMGILSEIDKDPRIGEIMVNAFAFPKFDCSIYYKIGNKKYKYNKTFKNLEELKQIYRRTIAFENKELNSIENASVEATRENGDRIQIIIPEASKNYVLNIRKFSNFVPDTKNMRESGTINDDLYKLLELIVKGKANIGIGGEMSTGKSSLINYLLTYTDKIERKVVISSVVETDIDRVLNGHDIILLTVNEEKGFTFEKLMKDALRTTASRIIVPESRGKEFKQIYEANLKTKGNMFTAHALDDDSFLDACVDMYMSSGSNENGNYVKDKLARSIDIIIIMAIYGNKIRIKSVSEVILDQNKNFSHMNTLYEWAINPENPTEGEYRKKGKMSKRLVSYLNSKGVPLSNFKEWGDI